MRGGSSWNRWQTHATPCQGEVWRLNVDVISRGDWKTPWERNPLSVSKPVETIRISETF